MTEQQPVILILDGEEIVLRSNARMLRRRGYDVRPAASCRQAREILAQCEPDLLILDVMLPDGSGFDLCESFRRTSDRPVIFLSGKAELRDRVEGLRLGCDYYLAKPCNMDELLAVTERLLRRRSPPSLAVIRRGSLTLDPANARAAVAGTDVGLTGKEFALLLCLVQNEDRVVSAPTLYETVWGVPAKNDTRTIRFHVANLRRKLRVDEAKDFDIVSSYGKGYLFTTLR